MSIPLAILLLLQAAPVTGRADYPTEALKHHWEGVAVAKLSISAEGRVTGCSILRSSGHQVLDDATCDLLVKRAIFKPARDAAGNPVASEFTTPPITWRIGN